MDLFSRFHWLAPLERKKSSFVKKELKRIYTLLAIRERIQSDTGEKFKKGVESYCKKNKIKINAAPVILKLNPNPLVYISDLFALPKQQNSGEIFFNMQRIIRSYGSMSRIVLELKRIINSPK